MPEKKRAELTLTTRVGYILLLALCYALAGRLSVLLAIPPGYATAMFPPAGIALVAVLLFGRSMAIGVFLGSLLLNLWIGHDLGNDISAGMPVAIGAATGAAIQALVACYLVRRWVKAPDELTLDTDIILFLLLGGPVACLVNATFGAGSLYLSGALTSSGFGYAWFTWWAGDSLGVVVSAPLLFILLASARGVWRKRRWLVGLPMLVLCAGLIWMFIEFSSWEVRQRYFAFQEDVKITQELLEARFERNLLALGALERFFSYSQNVSREEFKGYSSFFLQHDDDARALSWSRYINHAQREKLEQKLQQELALPYIFDLNNNQQTQRTTDAEHYVVVEYIEPMADNIRAVGLNVLSNPLRKAALLSALDSGKLTTSKKITLVQSGEPAVLMFYPVYASQVITTTAERRQNILGYITGVFAFKPLFDKLLANKEAIALELRLIDIDDNNELLYQTTERPADIRDGMTQIFKMVVGGRHWQIDYWLSADYKNTNSDLLAFAVLTIGLLFTSILGAFLLVMTGRAHHVGQLVTKRSAELKGVLDNALDTILTFDANGNIDSINPAGERLLQFEHSSLMQTPIRRILPELEYEQFVIENAKDDVPLKSRFDTIALRHDESIVPVEVALSNMVINNEFRFTVILRDLTERIKAERLKDDIISTVSHELRTPLTSIMGSLGLVNSGVLGPMPEKAVELVNLAMQNSQRLTMLVNDILELSKHQAQNYQQAQEDIPLQAFLQSAISLNSGYASQYDVSLELAPVEPELMVNGDEVKLMQVMSNLLSNAIKYSPRQGDVTVSARRYDAQHVDIAVQDRGNGIPEEFQQQVFQRFSQADSTDTRRVGGTGLGLAIAKIIVEKHQGKIWFETAPGNGTTFFVRLPLHNSSLDMPD